MTLYKKKYRVETTRLSGRDYGIAGKYFVTICTKKKLQWFGEVKDKEMVLNELGKIIADEWVKTSEIRPTVSLDAWCVMPNHFHGIIIINTDVETPRRGVSTTNKWKPGTLGSIINQFKGVATKRIRTAGFPEFQWQSRFHDRVIRSDKELAAIRTYIRSNPSTWDKETIPWHTDATSFGL